MKPNLLSFLFFYCILLLISNNTNFCFAQTTNSSYQIFDKNSRKKWTIEKRQSELNNALKFAKKVKDTEYIIKSYRLKNALFKATKEYDSANYYSYKLLDFGTQIKDSLTIIRAYKYLADNYNTMDSVNLAIDFYDKGYTLSTKLNQVPDQLRALQYTAMLQRKIGLSFEAEETLSKAIALIDEQSKKEDYTVNLIGIYVELGILYKERQAYEQALVYYKNGFDLVENKGYKSTFLNNIGNLYLDMQDYDNALENFNASLDIAEQLKDSLKIARVMCNIGVVKYHLNDRTSVQDIEKSLEIREKMNYLLGMYSSYYKLAKAYQHFNQTNKAKQNANEALKIATNLKIGEEQLETLKLLIDLGNTSHINSYLHLRDSLEQIESSSKHKYMSLKYNYQKEHEIAKENELKYLANKIELQEQHARKIMSRWGLVIGVIIAILVFLLIQNHHKRKFLAQIYDTEKRIAKQVHDEVANDIYHTMNKIQSHTIDEETALSDLDKIYQKTRDISKSNNDIDIDDHFSETLEELIVSYKKEGILLITTGISNIKWERCNKEKLIVLYRVIQELMTNMSKHSKASRVRVSFHQKGHKIAIDYMDNGIGTDFSKKSGLKNMENRISTVGGSIKFESNNNEGFKASLIL
ncbi:tetratricopeptide repeat-containing sensor histidine kinase [Neptunitalea lumnitzerae]|uniref:Histidine kinase/HSP90-like ATPase domain-containing protein n=1 Tax=Neptunitalea lumnitzerae TaxID=2965509 RepID=A0ABQ5MJ90_9FLAO|nr:tetratricopeptide repeat-containing sensor histidine kinase [Neptunitalea sp. Y10]GLB49474.1 hypothetical protein Y10_18420 [Neptunitalea sp. Y10]